MLVCGLCVGIRHIANKGGHLQDFSGMNYLHGLLEPFTVMLHVEVREGADSANHAE